MTEAKPGHPAPREFVRTLPTWKKVLVGAAVLMLIAGVVLFFVGGADEPERAADAAAGAGGAKSLGIGASALDAGSGPVSVGVPATAEAETPWSQAFFGYGFSFFVGFGIGYAVRAFLKLSLLFAGIFALLLFALSYFTDTSGTPFIEVNWNVLDGAFNRFADKVKEQTGAFRSFITGSLPNAGLAGLGLFAGFKRN